MTNILSFDSLYIVQPLRRLYLAVVRVLSNFQSSDQVRIILYRLDQDNILLTDARSLSGLTIGINQNKIDALSFEFYRYLETRRVLQHVY